MRLLWVSLFLLLGLSGYAQAAAPPCLAYDPINRNTLFSSSHRVYAHYFSRFPLSLDNQPTAQDYYAQQYLTASGEGGKWLTRGGFLRSRPLPVAPQPSNTYVLENMKHEVLLALSRGVNGFAFDILTLDDAGSGGYLKNMEQAVQAVEPRFHLLLMPDMDALQGDTDKVRQLVESVYADPSLDRAPNGSLMVAPFLAESVSPEAWQTLQKTLASEGKPITFLPTFLSLSSSSVAAYAPQSFGLGLFGTPDVNQDKTLTQDSAAVHRTGKLFMAGLAPQGYRPKETRYWESLGSLAYRNAWQGAIGGQAEWVQLTTWNDFSESTQIIPYMDGNGALGSAFFDLTGYYATWFLTGHAPPITRDVLTFFYRKEPVAAAAPAEAYALTLSGSSPGADAIELVGFLTAPGTLKITAGGQTYAFDVAAGLQSVHVPLVPGTPRFSLERNHKEIIGFVGSVRAMDIKGLPDGRRDLTYWSGRANVNGVCALTDGM